MFMIMKEAHDTRGDPKLGERLTMSHTNHNPDL